MRALVRLWSFGAQDADRRVERALAPQPLDPIDNYLQQSALVAAVDRVTQRLAAWWTNSTTAAVAASIVNAISDGPWRDSYRNIATVLLVAVIAHISLMLLQQAPPGWMWAIVPAITAAYAASLLAASSRSAD